MRRLSFTIIAAVLLSACRTVPETTRQTFDSDFDMALFADGFESDSSDSVTAVSWRQVITDSRLIALIDTALERNTALDDARQRIIQSQAALESSRMAFLPSVSLAPNAQSLSYASVTDNLYSLKADAEWNLSGSVFAMKNMAKWELEKSRAYRDAVQSDLILELTTQYLTLLMLDRQLELAQQDRESWERTEKAMQASLESGLLGNRTQVLQAHAAMLETESLILTISQSIHQTENSICSMLLKAPCPIERSTIDSPIFSDSPYSSVPLSLVSSRPDVGMARYELLYCAGATDLARSRFFPQVSLSGSIGWTNNIGGVITDPSEWLFSILGQLVQPVFSAGKNRAGLQQANAQYQIALNDARQTLLNADNQVNEALVSIRTATLKNEKDSERRSDMAEIVRQNELLMEHGTANIIEVLESRRSYTSACNMCCQDMFQVLCGTARLYHSLGTFHE